MKYSENEKQLLDSWKEKAGGWRWLHYHSMHHYKNINSKFVYSRIVLSTLAGAGGFSTAGSSDSQQTIMGKVQFYMGYIIGTTNVIIGLINSFQRFGKAAEKTELHASAAMQYAMLYRMIETELNLSDDHKRSELVSTVRQEMDRLLSQSPSVPQVIVDEYNKTFPDFENKPDICNGLSKRPASLPSELLSSMMNSTPPKTPPSTPKYAISANLALEQISKMSRVPRDTI